jgi:glutamate-ammonia-ligase adenylyltransferase
LFSFNRPSLQLYVRLCAATPYLAAILTSNPGMLDELMDSLVLNKLPDIGTLKRSLEDRCRGAEDLEPILHSFKNAHHLNAGVRDILGKEDIRNTTAFLSDVAEVCVQQIADVEHRSLIERYGQPWDSQADQPCSLVILGMGKLGGREPNYHSDLDVVFLFPCDGTTRHDQRKKSDRTTSNQHFFSELAQRITKRVIRMGPYGRLYEMDARLRPSGKSGSLAVSFDALRRYFTEGQGQLWERQALCRSRPIVGSKEARRGAMELTRSIIIQPEWQPEFANAIFNMRQRMEENASPRNLKRRPGGIVDVEFIAQMLQLKYAKQSAEVLQPGTIEALSTLADNGYLASEQADFLKESYRFLRSVEARLRLMNTTGRHDLPEDEHELAKLAYLFGSTTGAALAQQCEKYTQENRRLFVELFRAAARP